MAAQEISQFIIRPFADLMYRERLEAIKQEHDKELTHKPRLTKASNLIAHRRYQSDLDQTKEKMETLWKKDSEAIKLNSLSKEAKETLKKKRAVTPRIAVLYLDCNRRNKELEEKKLIRD